VILDSNNDPKGFLCYEFLSRNLKELGVILDSNNDPKGFLCYEFLSRNLKELGVLWLWTKNLFNRKRA
jgi:hypothetical protein